MQYECRECRARANREWAARNPESIKRSGDKRRAKNPEQWRQYAKRYRLRRGAKYVDRRKFLNRVGLTGGRWDALVVGQSGLCACCGDQLTRPVVDHDHTCCPGGTYRHLCGQCTRGLICQHCNLMLGHAKDDPGRLRAGIRYLGYWAALNGA